MGKFHRWTGPVNWNCTSEHTRNNHTPGFLNVQRKCSSWLCAFVSKLFKEQRCFSAKEDGCIAKPGTFIVLPGHMPAQWSQISNKIAFYQIQQQFPKLQVCFDKFKQVLQVVFVYFSLLFWQKQNWLKKLLNFKIHSFEFCRFIMIWDLDRANSIQTALRTCNLWTGRSVSYKSVDWF